MAEILISRMAALGRNRTLLVKFPKTLFSNKLALVLIIRNSTNTLCRHFQNFGQVSVRDGPFSDLDWRLSSDRPDWDVIASS
ncbi:MAG: hypothetical protein P8H53_12010 [Paracoccaceae bacterium]|nr:hypothetical protein [Paracoccaceae bacterium]